MIYRITLDHHVVCNREQEIIRDYFITQVKPRIIHSLFTASFGTNKFSAYEIIANSCQRD
jgi:serine/threonine protein phosphatase PrpC